MTKDDNVFGIMTRLVFKVTLEKKNYLVWTKIIEFAS